MNSNLIHPPIQIQTPRLILKKSSIDIAPLVFEVIDRERQRLGEFLPWVELTPTLESEINYLKQVEEWWNTGKQFDFQAFLNPTSENPNPTYVGNIGVHGIKWDHQNCEIGYWISGRFEGQGLVKEMTQALEHELFKMGFYRIEIRMDERNKRSRKIPIALGYHFEGCLKEDTKLTALERPTPSGRRSTLIYAKLRPGS